MTADQSRSRGAQAHPRATQRTRLNMQVTLPNGEGAVRLALREIKFTPSSGVRVTSTCEVASDDGIRNSPRLVLT